MILWLDIVVQANPDAKGCAMASTLKIMREAIEQRCRQIVTVFNGLFDLDVDPTMVLQGKPSGWNSFLHSILAPLPPPQKNVIRRDSSDFVPSGSWLMIDGLDGEDDMRLIFESANLLVWHELCHLADPRAIEQILGMVLLPKNSGRDARNHAREVVIDAIAFEMGRSLYAHPPKGQSIPRSNEERSNLMCKSLAALADRFCHLGNHRLLTTDQMLFIIRLRAELQTHVVNGSDTASRALFKLEQIWRLAIESNKELFVAYSILYGSALSLADVADLAFRNSLAEWEDETGENHYAARVYH